MLYFLDYLEHDFFCSLCVPEASGWALSLSAVIKPPVNISVTQTGWSAVRVTWEPVQDVLKYQVKVRVIDDPTMQPSQHNVSDTHLSVQGILPCSTYLISVSSFNNFLMLSEPTDYTYTTNSELTELLPRSWLVSRSAILSKASLSDMENIILRGCKDSNVPTTYLLLLVCHKI